jgi:tetratricopeptide (TPR) repeat protein
VRTLVILMALTAAAYGQRHKAVEDVDTEKPEGKLLQPALQENDPAKKAVLLEQFAQQFPKFDGTPWVLEQLQAIYVKAGDADKTIATGEKLLALDPDDPEAALQNLKAAETKKDMEGIKKWSAAASTNARKMASSPQPKEAEQVDSWKSEVAYAKQVDQYTDYAIYRAASESRDPKVTVELLELLQTHNPKSEYIPKAQNQLFLAYRQAGMNDKAVALAEKTLATDQTNEDMLLVAADSHSRSKTEPEKVHAYSAKLVELMASKPKPEGVSDADWAARRNLITGLAHYMSGALYYRETKYPQADKELRAALPLVGSNQEIKAEVLYELGFANYKMDKPQEAADYYRECSAIKSQFQPLATKNLQGIKTQFRGIK